MSKDTTQELYSRIDDAVQDCFARARQAETDAKEEARRARTMHAISDFVQRGEMLARRQSFKDSKHMYEHAASMADDMLGDRPLAALIRTCYVEAESKYRNDDARC